MIAKEKFLNNSLSYLYKQIRKVYLNSNIYNRKISRVFDGGLNYVPNLSLLNCIIKSKERNFRIEDFSLEDVWNKIDLNDKDFKKIHSFYWLFTINLKSSKKITQNIISNWIGNYESYSPKSWETNAKWNQFWSQSQKLLFLLEIHFLTPTSLFERKISFRPKK